MTMVIVIVIVDALCRVWHRYVNGDRHCLCRWRR